VVHVRLLAGRDAAVDRAEHTLIEHLEQHLNASRSEGVAGVANKRVAPTSRVRGSSACSTVARSAFSTCRTRPADSRRALSRTEVATAPGSDTASLTSSASRCNSVGNAREHVFQAHAEVARARSAHAPHLRHRCRVDAALEPLHALALRLQSCASCMRAAAG
jgi:hypothetical protein